MTVVTFSSFLAATCKTNGRLMSHNIFT